MVHQLSLVATIPHSSYIQTISTLQAFTGLLSPQQISIYTLLAKPHNVFKPKYDPGKVNQIEQYYMKCITTWDDENDENFDMNEPIIRANGDKLMANKLFNDNVPMDKIWTLQIADIPIAGQKQVVSAQTIYESTLVHHHTKVKHSTGVKSELTDFNDQSDSKNDGSDDKSNNDAKTNNDVKSEVEQDPVKSEDVEMLDVEEIETKPETNSEAKPETNSEAKSETEPETKPETKPEVKPTPRRLSIIEVEKSRDSFLQFLEDLGYNVINQYWIKGVRFFHGDIVIEIFKVFIRDDQLPSDDRIPLKLLDESNTFQIKAFINIPRSTDVELINQGIKQLTQLQEYLKKLIQLQMPDRIYMDSRVGRQH